MNSQRKNAFSRKINPSARLCARVYFYVRTGLFFVSTGFISIRTKCAALGLVRKGIPAARLGGVLPGLCVSGMGADCYLTMTRRTDDQVDWLLVSVSETKEGSNQGS